MQLDYRKKEELFYSKSLNTLQPNLYLNRYPTGKYQEKVFKVKDSLSSVKAIKSNSPKEMLTFISENQGGRHVNEVREAYNSLHSLHYKTVYSNWNDENTLLAFIENFPHSPYKEDISKRYKQLIRSREAKQRNKQRNLRVKETKSNNRDGTWAFTAKRVVTSNDLRHLNKDQIDKMRNEIYARHGWVFARADLRQYFSQKSWYRPKGNLSNRDYVNSHLVLPQLTSIEKKNATFIRDYERRRGFRR